MREKKFIITLACLSVVLMACGTAFAQQGKMTSGPYNGPMAPMVAPEAPAVTFYTNFEANSCTGCTYSAANGFLVLGPANCGIANATQWLAYPFISKATGNTRQVILAITDWSICVPSVHGITVQIMGDNCSGAPDTTNILGTTTTTIPIAPCLTARARLSVPLTAGTKYWVVVTTSTASSQTGTTAVWWEVNPAEDSFNLNDGNGWLLGPLGGPGAFSVQ
jgi:hypothetical protein